MATRRACSSGSAARSVRKTGHGCKKTVTPARAGSGPGEKPQKRALRQDRQERRPDRFTQEISRPVQGHPRGQRGFQEIESVVIIYNPLHGEVLTSPIRSRPRCCFLMTRLGSSVPEGVEVIRRSVSDLCGNGGYEVIDASARVTGRDFLLKIWAMIASTPLAVGVCHEEMPFSTQANIYYELGVAQALGKETLLVKSPGARVPSDFVRTEYVGFDGKFDTNFAAYLDSLQEQAVHYELIADQLDRNPVLALDYLKRAFLITGDGRLRGKARALLDAAGLDDRAKNSVEQLAAAF